MTRTELLGRITIDPNICFGKACIRGTRIWVALVIENLANGVSERELLDNYPSLVADDIRAALAYAAEITRERIIPSEARALQNDFLTDSSESGTRNRISPASRSDGRI